MSYLRVVKTQYENWFKDGPDAVSLAHHVFDLKKKAQSTYRASNATEEVMAVAAYLLADEDCKLEKRYVIRIEQEDLGACDLASNDDVFGQTGIVKVDCLHWDIVGEKQKFIRLVERLLTKIREGEDRIRWVFQSQVRYHINEFLGWIANAITPYGTRQCHKIQGLNLPLGVEPDYVSGEYDAAEPQICPDKIARLAYKKWQTHCRDWSNPSLDWLDAEAELRAAYKQHYERIHSLGGG